MQEAVEMAETTTGVSAHEKQTYLRTAEREFATTLKILRAYPADKSELQPHQKCKNARELAWMFSLEMGVCMGALSGTLEIGSDLPPAPDTLEACIAEFEKGSAALLEQVRSASTEVLENSTEFPVGPGQMGEIRNMEFLWFMLHDQIHHRGQFSIYLRMADGKVPSIYGPSGDEPWF
jgi:uncharacterized damage-inducible protein DinB